MPLIHVSGPSGEPVSVAEVKADAAIDGTEFDSKIPLVITAARRQAEAAIGRRLMTQRQELVLDTFPDGEIDLQLPDVLTIVSVKYLDVDGIEQTLDSTAYSLDKSSTPCWLLPAYGTDWPATIAAANAVRVQFDVGFGAAASDVPEDIRLWIRAQVAQEFGRSPSPFIAGLLDFYRVWRAV